MSSVEVEYSGRSPGVAVRRSWRAIAGLVGLLSFGSLAAAQDAALNLRFIPPEAMAAVVAYPQAAASLPEMELMPKEIIAAAGLQQLGFNPLEVESAVAFVEPPAGGPPGFGAVLRFSKPYNRETLLPMLVAQTQPGTIGGREVLKAAQPFLPSLMFPNDRTVVIAPEATLAKMLKPQQGKNPLVDRLKNLKGQHHIAAVVLLDPVRPMLNAQLAQAPVPPPFAQFKNIPDHVSAVEVMADFTAPGRLHVALQAPSAASAKQLQDLLAQALQLGKQMFLAQMAQQAASDDPVEQAAAQYAERLANHFLKMLTPQQQGDRVTLEMESQGGVAATGTLVALLLPAVQAAREAARRTSASNSLRQIAIAMHNYHDTNGRFPPHSSTDKQGKPLLSWRVHLLPYLGEERLYRQFHLDEPWDSQHNRQLIEQMPAAYRSPNLPAQGGMTNFVVPTGENTLFAGTEGTPMRDIRDGTSNTILAVEAGPTSMVVWTQPEDLSYDPENPLQGLLGLRPGGFQAALADGSVRFISESVDRQVLRALFTPNGGETVRLE